METITINETINKNDVLFCITKEIMQGEARERIGRNLTADELNIAKKELEGGLMFDIDTVF